MPALYANDSGLSGVAAQLATAAQRLATLAATPPAHTPLAADETSTSAAARLSEHGAVMASRAADAAEVLRSAALAVHEVSRAFGQMDRDNAATVSLRGGASGGVQAAMNPAVTANLVAADVPIVAAPARDGEVSAAMMEGGQSQAGNAFVSSCNNYGAAFRDSAVAARSAQAAVDESLQGQTGPRLSAALQRFAVWADAMTAHSATVATAASGHAQRFDTAKQDTPRTQTFSNKKRELANAQVLNQRFPGAYSGVVTKLQGELASLHTQAGFAATNYHVGELPAAPPPPPPVTPVVNPTSPGQPDGQTTPGEAQDPSTGRHPITGEDTGTATDAAPGDADAGLAGTGLGPDGTPLPADDPALTGAPGEGDLTSQAAPIAAMLPSMLAGVLGGVMGAATAVPAQIGQQVQALASQAGQAVQGLTQGLSEPDLGEFDTATYDPESLGDLPSGGGGVDSSGGGGGTDPAAGPSAMPPSSGGMLAMGAPTGPAAPLVGAAPAAGPLPAAGPGGMGMPMMMPMMPMAGTGGQGAGTRPVKDPDKTIHIPGEPNSEMVKGEVQRRETAVADDPTGEKKRAAASAAAAPSPTVTSLRRIELPKDQ